jgi:hypothetical protein
VEQSELLRHCIDVLERLQVPYMIVGSFASSAYGEPRFTQDIDIVVELAAERVSAFCAAFPQPDFYLSEQAVHDAVRGRFQFNVLHPASGNKIDFMLPRDDDWGRVQLQRRQPVQLLPDRLAYAARPEDVILGKMWYYQEGGSEKHLRDITGILRIRGDRIDQGDVGQWAEKLGLSIIWHAILKRLQSDQHPSPPS